MYSGIYEKDFRDLGSGFVIMKAFIDWHKKYNDNLFIKVRSTRRLIKARVNLDKTKTEVNLEENEIGISPGQACVFYSKNKFGDKVLGGGWISSTFNNYLST